MWWPRAIMARRARHKWDVPQLACRCDERGREDYGDVDCNPTTPGTCARQTSLRVWESTAGQVHYDRKIWLFFPLFMFLSLAIQSYKKFFKYARNILQKLAETCNNLQGQIKMLYLCSVKSYLGSNSRQVNKLIKQQTI